MRTALFAGVMAWALWPCLSADDLVVDLGGTGQFTDIQSAVDAAKDGDTVIVKPGEYVITEPVDFNRNPAATALKNVAVRSEAGAEATIIRMSDAPVDPAQATVVVFRSGESAGSVLDGFTLTAGKAGGVLCRDGSSPSVAGCRITGNSADRGGGVSCLEDSSPVFTDCLISGNSAVSGGGVWVREKCFPTLRRCTISGNLGGGLNFGDASSPVLEDCTISGNAPMEAGSTGDGLSLGNSAPTLIRCNISGNSTNGIFCFSQASRAELIDCTLSGNGDFGFLGLDGMGPMSLTNCAIWGNSGGVLAPMIPSVTLTNCTISGNSGVGVQCPGSVLPILTNCIVWPDPACGQLSSCLTDRDPLFVKKGAFDFNRRKMVKFGDVERDMPDFVVEEPDLRLQPGSPAIDSGTPEGAPGKDIEGQDRPCGGGVDIGAHELCSGSSVEFIRADADGSGRVDITDPIFLLNHLFLGGGAPTCLDAGDANDDDKLDISDAVYSLSFQFLGGSPPESPFPGCGTEKATGGLDCQSYAGCP